MVRKFSKARLKFNIEIVQSTEKISQYSQENTCVAVSY